MDETTCIFKERWKIGSFQSLVCLRAKGDLRDPLNLLEFHWGMSKGIWEIFWTFILSHCVTITGHIWKLAVQKQSFLLKFDRGLLLWACWDMRRLTINLCSSSWAAHDCLQDLGNSLEGAYYVHETKGGTSAHTRCLQLPGKHMETLKEIQILHFVDPGICGPNISDFLVGFGILPLVLKLLFLSTWYRKKRENVLMVCIC